MCPCREFIHFQSVAKVFFFFFCHPVVIRKPIPRPGFIRYLIRSLLTQDQHAPRTQAPPFPLASFSRKHTHTHTHTSYAEGSREVQAWYEGRGECGGNYRSRRGITKRDRMGCVGKWASFISRSRELLGAHFVFFSLPSNRVPRGYCCFFFFPPLSVYLPVL